MDYAQALVAWASDAQIARVAGWFKYRADAAAGAEARVRDVPGRADLRTGQLRHPWVQGRSASDWARRSCDCDGPGNRRRSRSEEARQQCPLTLWKSIRENLDGHARPVRCLGF